MDKKMQSFVDALHESRPKGGGKGMAKHKPPMVGKKKGKVMVGKKKGFGKSPSYV